MCGIGGAAALRDKMTVSRVLADMTRSMRHRGPDDDGAVTFGNGRVATGLCATRLAVQDPSERGHQPMVSARSGRGICFNGEIYNVAELRGELVRRGHHLGSGSDTEVVLAAFDEWGP